MKKICSLFCFTAICSSLAAQAPATAVREHAANSFLQAICTLAWPVVTIIIFAILYPQVRKILKSRSFLVKVGGMEINVQTAADQIGDQLHELQNKVIELSCIVAGREPREEPAPGTVHRKWRVLWVTGKHESHALEIHFLETDGIEVLRAHTTEEALHILYAQAEILDGVITGVNRNEHGVNNPSAGLELIKKIKEKGYSTPIFVMCSEKNIREYKAALKAAGAVEATSSSLQLYGMLKHAGINCSMKPLVPAPHKVVPNLNTL